MFVLRSFLFAFALLLAGAAVQAQVIYECDDKANADAIVYVSDDRGKADVVVYVTEWRQDAEPESGIWYRTLWREDADMAVWYTPYRNEATLVIAYTPYQAEAEWRTDPDAFEPENMRLPAKDSDKSGVGKNSDTPGKQ